ncbi:MAG: TetR/AcrR family transcriptional regulator [Velocimicrobium sp.]
MDKNEKKIDRRISKTKNQITIALAAIAKEKSVFDISVKELTDKANINRGTFYLHYQDIYDMLEKIEIKLLEDFKTVIENRTFDEINGCPVPLIAEFCECLSKNALMYTVLLGPNGDSKFVNKTKTIVREYWLSHWKNFICEEKLTYFEYFLSYNSSGCIGILNSWLLNGMNESPKEMSLLVENIIYEGLKYFSLNK